MVVPVGANFTAELNDEGGTKPVYLINLDFSTGNRRFAMWPHNVTFNGETFTGLGPIAGIEQVEWTTTPLTEVYLEFFVQNDPDLLADIQQNSRERPAGIRLVFVDDDNAAIDDDSIHLARRDMIPGRLTGGRGTYRAQLGLESRFHRQRNRAPRTYSNGEQQKTRDATDFCFRDVGLELDITRNKYRQKSGLS